MISLLKRVERLEKKKAIEVELEDPRNPLVEHLVTTYPYGREAVSLRSIIRVVVWTVSEMKDRGYFK